MQSSINIEDTQAILTSLESLKTKQLNFSLYFGWTCILKAALGIKQKQLLHTLTSPPRSCCSTSFGGKCKTRDVHLTSGILQTLGRCSPDCCPRCSRSNTSRVQRPRLRKMLLCHMHVMYHSCTVYMQGGSKHPVCLQYKDPSKGCSESHSTVQGSSERPFTPTCICACNLNRVSRVTLYCTGLLQTAS